jgi:hypothetical protein
MPEIDRNMSSAVTILAAAPTPARAEASIHGFHASSGIRHVGLAETKRRGVADAVAVAFKSRD